MQRLAPHTKTAPRASKRSQSPPRAKAPSEADTQAAILRWLSLAGIAAYVTDASLSLGRDGTQRERLPSGWPDLTCVAPNGQALFIETKAPKGRLRASQIALHSQLRGAGALVVVARTLGEVVEVVAAEYAYDHFRDLKPAGAIGQLHRAIKGYREGHGAA